MENGHSGPGFCSDAMSRANFYGLGCEEEAHILCLESQPFHSTMHSFSPSQSQGKVVGDFRSFVADNELALYQKGRGLVLHAGDEGLSAVGDGRGGSCPGPAVDEDQ